MWVNFLWYSFWDIVLVCDVFGRGCGILVIWDLDYIEISRRNFVCCGFIGFVLWRGGVLKGGV